ncbi:extracellular solute-binding protein [Actinoallomurus purpureus]|uniref:ABC transporter substrate-binding protein n=1 Tax=Actinoallomurus purpureus TaxID=478114 RepID=UPI0020923A62|nr:extracellular solute-binding protein [Actinoallomurus purpureus]MCO6004238.1 extracellular solute-binding protein [Actinoallomurus purpureus]
MAGTAAALLLAGCTSAGPASSGPATAISAGASHAPTTISVWTFNHLPNEVAAFTAALNRLHAKFPWLTVKFVPNKDDAAFAKAVAAGDPPDVFVAAAPDNVGKFCANGTVADLGPYLSSAKVNTAATFPAATLVYTKYQGKQCALPLLTDAFGLYYNKKMFAAAGITTPPKTLSELAADAKKLTVKNADGSIKTFGFVSRSDYNANRYLYTGVQSASRFYGGDGKATFATDPKWQQMLQWDKNLNDSYGPGNAQKFVGRYQPHADDTSNPFLTGAAAMEFDGEWHIGEIDTAKKGLDYGVAPMPVLDAASGTYGAGDTLGTVAYLPAGSKHKQEGFFALQQLTTDTTFLNTLADTVSNIPSTFASLQSWDKASDAHWKPLVDMFKNPGSYYKTLTPAGEEDMDTWKEFLLQYEQGKVANLPSGLTGIAKKIDNLNTQAGN